MEGVVLIDGWVVFVAMRLGCYGVEQVGRHFERLA